MARILDGERPARPMAPGTVPAVPMEDALWNLVCRCWVAESKKPETIVMRPSAREVFLDLLDILHYGGSVSPIFSLVQGL